MPSLIDACCIWPWNCGKIQYFWSGQNIKKGWNLSRNWALHTKILIDQTLIDALTMKLWSVFLVDKKFLVKIIPHLNGLNILSLNRQWGFTYNVWRKLICFKRLLFFHLSTDLSRQKAEMWKNLKTIFSSFLFLIYSILILKFQSKYQQWYQKNIQIFIQFLISVKKLEHKIRTKGFRPIVISLNSVKTNSIWNLVPLKGNIHMKDKMPPSFS